MTTQQKRKVAHTLSMTLVTTGASSFVLHLLNLGLSEQFVLAWLRAWSTGYAVLVPTILIIGPRVQAQVNRLFH